MDDVADGLDLAEVEGAAIDEHGAADVVGGLGGVESVIGLKVFGLPFNAGMTEAADDEKSRRGSGRDRKHIAGIAGKNAAGHAVILQIGGAIVSDPAIGDATLLKPERSFVKRLPPIVVGISEVLVGVLFSAEEFVGIREVVGIGEGCRSNVTEHEDGGDDLPRVALRGGYK